jgi:epoxide hydrolase-like predicted phosphatase
MIKKLLLPLLMFTSTLIPMTNNTPTSIPNHQISVIFDMNGVLVETKGEIYLFGIEKLVSYAVTQNPLTLKKQIKENLFQLLNGLEERHPLEVESRDEREDLLPQCLCNWMKGVHSAATIKNMAHAKLDLYPQDAQTNLLRDMTHLMFTPEIFSKTQHLVPSTAEFVKELKEKGYRVYILSNFCSESFNHIKQRYADFFELFDGIIVSAEVGFIKPDPNIYRHLLTTHDIDPRTACFIDDVPVNVHAAKSLGIHGIHCPLKHGYITGGTPDIETVRREFQAWRNSLLMHDAAIA